MTPYTCKRGGTLTIHVKVITGLTASVAGTPIAKMKAFKKGGAPVMPGSDVPVAATLLVVPTIDGWDLTLTEDMSQLLTAGIYLLDMVYTVGLRDYVDGPVLVEIKNSASTSP